MSTEKDCYATLGVSPDAEDIVIRAAYRALAQRYHPDRFGGSQEEAHAHMSELNRAFGILSDKDKHASYDQLRGAKMQSGGSQFSDVEQNTPPGDDPLERDWRIAVSYYPDLADLEKRLSEFSWKLANTYRAYLLDSRQFDSRESLAVLMEKHFLCAYFGDNERTLEFARKLVLGGQRKAALALNEAIRVLGSNANPSHVIPKLAREFDVRHLALNKEKICSLLAETRASNAKTSSLKLMLSELGATVANDAEAHPSGRAGASNGYEIEFEGRQFKFQSEYEFRSWFKREVLPMAEQMAQ